MAIHAMRSAAAAAFRLERRTAEPLFVVRCSLGVAIALLAGFLSGHPVNAVAAAMGAMSTGFGSLQGVYRTRAATMLAMAAAMAFSTIAGAMSVHAPVLAIVLLAIWGLAYGLFASLGPAAAGICVNAAIALIVFGNFALTPRLTIEVGVSVLAGGILQTILLVVLWPVQRYPEERRALASAYHALAAYARGLGADNQPFPASVTLQSVRTALADPRPFGRRAAVAAFQALLNEAERLRATLTRIAAEDVRSFEPVRAQTAAMLDEIACALEEARAPAEGAFTLDTDESDPLLQTLNRQLKTAWRNARAPIRGFSFYRPSGSIVRSAMFNLDSALERVRANCSIHSPFGRHAIRLAVVLAVAGALAQRLPQQRGYWIPLTAVLVLRPDFTSTISRGFARIGGTLIGVLASTALVMMVPDTPHASLALAIIFATIGYAVFQINYALYTLCITAYVVFILSLTGAPEEAAMLNRLIATSAGGALAIISYLLWPTWEAAHTRERFATLLRLDREYAGMLFDGLAEPSKRNTEALATLRYRVWSARAAAEESLERMLAEPDSTHELDASIALSIAAAARRFALANIALGSLYADPSTAAIDLSAIRVPLDRALDALVADLLEGKPSTEIVREHLDKIDESLDSLAEFFNRAQKP